ncbi:MAG: hypothetical protein U0Q16_37065 [Bryobacteraceae bacterium]
MSRGWESKDVESQQEQRELARAKRDESRTAADVDRESLELSRTRVLNELASTKHPRRKQQLEAALAHLDEQLAKLRGEK